MLTAIGLARIYRAESLLMLVLGGIISIGLCTSILSMIKMLADLYNPLPAIVFWPMGRLLAVDMATVVPLAFPMLISRGFIMAAGKCLNALSMGDYEATTLRVNVLVERFAGVDKGRVHRMVHTPP